MGQKVSWFDTKIAECKNWKEFRKLAESQRSETNKGDLFERLTQLYLQTHPTYRSKIKTVWWCNNSELPEEIRKKLSLPKTDEGIDLLCETFEGEYWSVQSKYQTNSDRPLNYKKLSTFLSLSFVTAKGISKGLVVHTSTKKVKKSHLMGNTVELGLQHWLDLSEGQWDQILELCKGKILQPPKKRVPRKYQRSVINKAKEYFLKKENKRGKIIMPCGTGKSLIAYWVNQALKAKSVIVAVPSLALIKQSLEDWTSEFLAEGIYPEWIAVCSDDSVGKMKEADSTVATVYETGIPATTNLPEITKFIKKKTDNPKVIFTTYQSGEKLAEACRKAQRKIELLIADEAHKTVGKREKKFATLLFDENIKIEKRLFMTATERVYRQGTENIVSMNDESIYGQVFYEMSFAKAISDKIICDYKILTVSVSQQEVANLMNEQTQIIAQLNNQKVETDAHNLVAGIAVEKVFSKYGIKHAISFHRSIKKAEDFSKQQDAFSGQLNGSLAIKNFNISSKLSAGQRSQVLKEFISKELSLISNARCLTEGIDIPAIDCVAFIDPKQSKVDIVQAAGRAMRQSASTGKSQGYIVLPIIVPENVGLMEFSETTDFKAVARILAVLSTQDERIAEQLRMRISGQPPKPEDIIIIDDDINSFLDVSYQDFFEEVTTKIWQKVARANYRSFELARDFVWSLNLKDQKAWKAYIRSGMCPPDIPSNPNLVYPVEYSGYGDWLGTGRIRDKVWLDYDAARKVVRSFNLKNSNEFFAYAKNKKFPEGVPASPTRVYAGKGWLGFGDFLGTGTIAPGSQKYLPFNEARKFAKSLKLSSSAAWYEYNKKVGLPDNIPVTPDRKYKNEGWLGFEHWLGKSSWPNTLEHSRPFEEARKFVRSLKIKNSTEWRDFVKSEQKPEDIPAYPERVYKDVGWVSMPDWIGQYNVAKGYKTWLPFEEARKLVVRLGLKSVKEWQSYTNSGAYDERIPKNPATSYRKDWKGYGDWLGTGTIAAHLKVYPNFDEAREIAKSLGLKSVQEWRSYKNSDSFDERLPKAPERVYENKGWDGYAYWLGFGVRTSERGWRSFQSARKFVRSLGLKGERVSGGWRDWCKSGERPHDIPTTPDRVYKNEGWKGMNDWLGIKPK